MDTAKYLKSLIYNQIQYDNTTCHGWPDPVFASVRTDEANWRLPRLTMAWGHISAAMRLMSKCYQSHFIGAVVSMTDDKGALIIVWRDEMSRIMFEGIVVGGWQAVGGGSYAHELK